MLVFFKNTGTTEIYTKLTTLSLHDALPISIENSIGKHIKSTLFGWHPPYTVTAVVNDPPQNTNVSFDAILCSDDLLNQKSFIETSVSQIWTFATLQMYVKVPFHTNIDELEMELKNLSLKFDNNSDIDLHMMPITDIRHHLKCKTSFTLNFIRLFVVSGVLLLFTAIFNFLNLHFELFRRRKREFHLRIVNGASVRQLFVQIIFELLCITVVSLIPAWFFIWVTHGLFIKLLMIQIQFSDILLLFISFGIMVLCIMLVVSMIPILRLIHDSKQAISERAITGNPLLRRIVVSMQLAVSLVFIIAALVMTMQMHFVNHKDLGFERDGIIHLSGISMFLPESIKTELKKELIAIPQIKMVTDAYIEPEHNVSSQNLISDLEWPGKESDNASVFYRLPIDSQFDEVFGIKISDG